MRSHFHWWWMLSTYFTSITKQLACRRDQKCRIVLRISLSIGYTIRYQIYEIRYQNKIRRHLCRVVFCTIHDQIILPSVGHAQQSWTLSSNGHLIVRLHVYCLHTYCRLNYDFINLPLCILYCTQPSRIIWNALEVVVYLSMLLLICYGTMIDRCEHMCFLGPQKAKSFT